MAAGKNLGRTKLTEISPKKTVEGALGGLASSVAVALGVWKVTHWPSTPTAAAGLGVSVCASVAGGREGAWQHRRMAGRRQRARQAGRQAGAVDGHATSASFLAALPFSFSYVCSGQPATRKLPQKYNEIKLPPKYNEVNLPPKIQ